jgi:uncharacterized protein (TIGR03086 family)
MSANLRMYTKALYGFDHVARQAASSSDWDRPAPTCEGWTARSIVGHVLAIQRYMESLVRDTAPTMNPMSDPHLNAEGDAYAAWAAARDGVLDALDQPDVLHRVVNNWSGPTEVDAMIGFNVGDTSIHTWDLAQALGVPVAIPDEQCEHVLAVIGPVADMIRSPGMLGARVDIGDDASAQARMLALSGRQPG